MRQLLFVAALLLCASSPAHAALDLGSGILDLAMASTTDMASGGEDDSGSMFEKPVDAGHLGGVAPPADAPSTTSPIVGGCDYLLDGDAPIGVVLLVALFVGSALLLAKRRQNRA